MTLLRQTRRNPKTFRYASCLLRKLLILRTISANVQVANFEKTLTRFQIEISTKP